MRRRLCSCVVLLALFSFACGEVGPGDTPGGHSGDDLQAAKSAQTSTAGEARIEWIREIDADAEARARAVGSNGQVYVAGSLSGALPGFPVGRRGDGFIRAFDADGNELWTDQFDFGAIEIIVDVAVDATGVYALGSRTFASVMQGEFTETFIRKYAPDGSVLWTEFFGFEDLRETSPSGFVLDDTGIYVSGTAGSSFAPARPIVPFDAFVARVDLQGNLVWSELFGGAQADDEASGITISKDRLFVSGWTDAALLGETNRGGRDAFAASLDLDGNLIWTDQFGSPNDDEASDVTSSDGRIHLTGHTFGALSGQANTGESDAFIRTYAADGSVQWTDQFGTASDDFVFGSAIDAGDTGVYVVGFAGAALTEDGPPQGGMPTVRKYDFGGHPVWTLQFSEPFAVDANAVDAEGGAIYVAGFSYLAKIVERDDGLPDDCEAVEGDVVIDRRSDASRIDAIAGCFDIQGHLFIQDTDDIESLEFLSGLRSVEGYVGISDNADLRSLAGLDDLETIGEGLVIEGNPALETIIHLDSLESVTGNIHIFGNPLLERIELSALRAAGELLVAGNDALLALSAPQLVSLDRRLLIENNDLLHTVVLSSLQDVGTVKVRFNPALDDLDDPS